MRSVIITSPFGPARAFKRLDDGRWELTIITPAGEEPGGTWEFADVVMAVREIGP
jgi:hypothetical protein